MVFIMIYVGIDIAKNKHDCVILSDHATCLRPCFSLKNNSQGFALLINAIKEACGGDFNHGEVKAGLEATGHYAHNIVAFLNSNGIDTTIFNPFLVNQYRKSRSLRKTKTDKADAMLIAELLISTAANPATSSYHNQEMKTLCRYRFSLVKQRSKLKADMSRYVDLLFPELGSLGLNPTSSSVMAMLKELLGASYISICNISQLTDILSSSSRGRYGKETAEQVKAMAKESIATANKALSYIMSDTIEQICLLNKRIAKIDGELKNEVEKSGTKLTSIPGIGFCIASVILAEIGDINLFSSADKLQAFAGLDPSTFQSGNFTASHTHMVKRGSAYLRWAIMQGARLCSLNNLKYKQYLDKKIKEGKHYNSALGHLSKKLIRLIFHLLKENEEYDPKVA